MRPPSVDSLARALEHTGLAHPVRVEVARQTIAQHHGEDHAAITERGQQLARLRERRLLASVINATGTLLHTNLGRAPWPTTTSATYTNLEFELETGKRGSRQRPVGELFALLTGSEKAIVVNNCAAAVTLVTAALAGGKGVCVSRSELVEIGGGFRVPEVIAQSGASLIEVGTTNRTRSSDYRNAINNTANDIAMALSVHQSNYKIVGFTEAPSVTALSDLGVPLICDIGSGLLDTACPWLENGPPSWLEGEPGAKQTLAAGADLVCFSGDKLLGGPQAGIIAGRADLVDKAAKHPLARAFRPGSLVLNSLQELAIKYLERKGSQIPFWEMATRELGSLSERAAAIEQALRDSTTQLDSPPETPNKHTPAQNTPAPQLHERAVGARRLRFGIAAMDSVPGGGTLPTVSIPSVGLSIEGDHTDVLRDLDRPIIARVQEGETLLDLRTVDPGDDAYLIVALTVILAKQT